MKHILVLSIFSLIIFLSATSTFAQAQISPSIKITDFKISDQGTYYNLYVKIYPQNIPTTGVKVDFALDLIKNGTGGKEKLICFNKTKTESKEGFKCSHEVSTSEQKNIEITNDVTFLRITNIPKYTDAVGTFYSAIGIWKSGHVGMTDCPNEPTLGTLAEDGCDYDQKTYDDSDHTFNLPIEVSTIATATATTPVVYGDYSIYATHGSNNNWTRVVIKNKIGSIVDILLINQGESIKSSVTGLTIKLVRIMALEDGTVVGAEVEITSGRPTITQLGNYPNFLIKDEQLDVFVVVGANAQPADIIGAVDLVANLPRTTKSIVLLDTEVSVAEKSKNLILVGGPCINSLVEDLAIDGKFPYTCRSWPSRNFGIIKVIDDVYTNGKVVIVVAGTRSQDIRLASQILQNYDTKLKGITSSEVEITGISIVTTTIKSST